jgi:hypothetical protein
MLRDQGRGERNWLHRIETEKLQAKQRGEDISDEEGRRRAVAKLHRPKLQPLDNWDRYADPYDPRRYGTEIMVNNVSIALPKCWTMLPAAVHAKRKYRKITTEASRMIEEGGVQREEICFICSEFFVWVRNGEHFLVRFGERRIPSRIDKHKSKVCYEDGTVILEGYPPIFGGSGCLDSFRGGIS